MIVRRIVAVVSLLFAFIIDAGPALAVGDAVFVVPRVTVQARAASATAAKVAAQQEGRRRAVDILLRRLTVEDDWIYLPQLAAGEEIDGAAPIFDRGTMVLSDRDLEALESGFEVYNEKSSPTTYRALITYRFKPAAIRRLLKDAGIPYSEAQTRTALVLPVLETVNGVYLWEENNPWMTAWKARPFNNELTPMIAPLGDLEDARTISARQAIRLDETALLKMAERYSVTQVIVAHAQLRQTDGADRLSVRLINAIRESGEISNFEDERLSTEVFSDFSLERSTSATHGQDEFIPARIGDVLAEETFSQPSGNFPALAELAIDRTIAAYAKPWKQRTLIDHTAAALLEVSAYYQSLSEWTKIRAALISTPLIGSVQVRSFSRQGAELLIQAYGEPSKLIVAMEALGLALWTDDEYWSISTPATAQRLRSRRRR